MGFLKPKTITTPTAPAQAPAPDPNLVAQDAQAVQNAATAAQTNVVEDTSALLAAFGARQALGLPGDLVAKPMSGLIQGALSAVGKPSGSPTARDVFGNVAVNPSTSQQQQGKK